MTKWSSIRQGLQLKRGDRVGSVFTVSLKSYGGSLGGVKANAVGLDVRNLMRSPKHREDSVIRFSVNLGHSVSIWALVSRSNSPHEHGIGSWGRNLALYSPIGAWFRIVLVARTKGDSNRRGIAMIPLLRTLVGIRRVCSSGSPIPWCHLW